MAAKKYSFDPECLTLAEYFYPQAAKDRLYDLAQRIQDQVEADDLEAPAPETKASPSPVPPHEEVPSAPVEPAAEAERANQGEGYISGETLRSFLGWLSADIKELNGVEVPRLLESWNAFNSPARAGLNR